MQRKTSLQHFVQVYRTTKAFAINEPQYLKFSFPQRRCRKMSSNEMNDVIDCWRCFTIFSSKSDMNNLRQQVEDFGAYDLHDILRQRKKIQWCQWHLNINENDKAIKIAEEFHQNSKRLKFSSSIVDQVHIIEETFLEYMPKDDHWNEIMKYFKKAREHNDPLMIVKAYTFSQQLSSRLNKHLAVNTYHTLKLYCTILNCPILAQAQEYTEAFAKILFHPKLEEYAVRTGTFYRGLVLEDKKFVENYNEQATILTTTFLSTSTKFDVAEQFSHLDSENKISVFCIYNINNINRRTALDLRKISFYPHEEEILILPFIPFVIKSIERMNDGRRMTICFDECTEGCVVPSNSIISTTENTQSNENHRREMEDVLHLERHHTTDRSLVDYPNETRISLSSINALPKRQCLVQ